MGRVSDSWKVLVGKKHATKERIVIRYVTKEVKDVVKIYNDSSYFQPTDKDMTEALKWACERMTELGYVYTPEIEDCDEFALQKMLLVRRWFRNKGVVDECPDAGYYSYKTDNGAYHAIIGWLNNKWKLVFNESTCISKGKGHWKKALSQNEIDSVRRVIK